MTERRRAALAACLVLAVTCTAYLPSLGNGFTNWDDQTYVTRNPLIRSLSWSSLGLVFRFSVMGLYHPLTTLSLAVDHHLFGLNPAGYHAINLALHLANGLLVFLILRILAGSLVAATSGALFFGVHPLHVESVAWIAERKDVLSAFFFFAALLVWLRRDKGKRPGFRRLSSVVLLAASLLAKPMGVTFPLVLYLCDYLAGRRISSREHLERSPFALLSLLSGILTLTAPAFAPSLSAEPEASTSPLLHFFVASHALVFYLTRTLVPVGLSALYPYPDAIGSLPWEFLLSPLVVAAIGAATLSTMRVSRKIPFGLLFFVITLLPVIVVRIGPHAAADRYTYIPSLGLCYLGGIGFACTLVAVHRRARWVLAAKWALALTVFCFSLMTWRRTLIWHDSITLWSDVLGRTPSSWIARKNRAIALIENGEPARAVDDLMTAIAVARHDADLYRTRGRAYQELGMTGQALADFDRAIALRSSFVAALNDRGALRVARGELPEAINDFNRALAVDPGFRLALLNRAGTRQALGDQAGAEEDRARARLLEQ